MGSKAKAFPSPPNWCFCVGWVVEQNGDSCFFRNNNPRLFSHLQSTPRNSAGVRARASIYTHFVIDTTYTSDYYHFRSCWHLPCKAVLGKFASFSPILLFLFKGGQAVSVVSVTCKLCDLLTFSCSNVTVYYLLSSVNNYHPASWVTWACRTCFTVKWDHILWSNGLLLVCTSQNVALFQFWC